MATSVRAGAIGSGLSPVAAPAPRNPSASTTRVAGPDPHALLPGQEWASAEQIARRLGMSVKWVHRHRVALGVARVSPGSSNSKLRFHVRTADEWMRSQMESPPASNKRRGRRGPERTDGTGGPMSFRR